MKSAINRLWIMAIAAMIVFSACGGDSTPVSGIILDKSTITLNLAVGETETITATIQPTNATNKNLKWSSNNPGVVTVDNGIVTAVATGSATVTVTTEENAEIKASCSVNVNFISTTGIEMVSIHAGTFTMGSPEDEPERDHEREAQHSVTLTKNFYMGKYEVTQKQWVAVMGAAEDRTTEICGKGDNYPVYNVSWYDIIVFCNKLSIKENLNPVYSINGDTNPAAWGTIPGSSDATWNAVVMDLSKNGYRLPTDAEWEYSCRGGSAKPFGIGDGTKMVSGMANFNVEHPYDLNYEPAGTYNDSIAALSFEGKTKAVGSYSSYSNNYGLYDMHGNVYELCWDWFQKDISTYIIDPVGPESGTDRIARGASWGVEGALLRSSFRKDFDMAYRSEYGGFRLVRNR